MEDTAGKPGINKKQIHNLNGHRGEQSDGEFGLLSKKEAELKQKTLAAGRSKVMKLYNAGRISVLVCRFIKLDLDLREMQQDQRLSPNDPV